MMLALYLVIGVLTVLVYGKTVSTVKGRIKKIVDLISIIILWPLCVLYVAIEYKKRNGGK